MTNEEFKKARSRLRLKQTDLAEMLGIAGETISRIENGHLDVPVYGATILRLLLRYPAGVDYLLNCEET